MENRERDRVSQRTSPTEAGQRNRQVEEGKGREHNSGTSAEFGQSIGRSENLEGGTMNNNRNRTDNRNDEVNSNSNLGNESSRRPTGSDYSSSTGRSSGSMGGSSSSNDISSDTGKRRGNSTGEMGSTGSSGKSSNWGDSSEGRH